MCMLLKFQSYTDHLMCYFSSVLFDTYWKESRILYYIDICCVFQPPEGTTECLESPNMDAVLRDENNFIQNVSQFFNQEAISDVILKVDDQRYYGHKFVLAKSSDVFRTMLYERNWAQSTKEEVELSESAECQAVFELFLKYLYTAEISISISTAVGILCLADKYNVESLKSLCTQYMITNSRSPKVRNALTWYPWAKALHLEQLIEQCTKTIAWNCQDIITSPEWLNMDLEFLTDMLQSSELVVQNEFVLLEAVTRWLMHEPHIQNLEDNSTKLIGLIRFPLLHAHQLYFVEQSDIASRSECRELLQNLLSQAYRFRALCPYQHQLGVSFGEPYYLPRDYIDLAVDNVRMQNALRFGIQVDVKMYRGAVPVETRDGDWKITYRKPQNDNWSLQFYCHETALVNNEARLQPTVVVYNDQEKVIQVQREPVSVVSRGTTLTTTIAIEDSDQARNMVVLLKPVPS